MLTLPRLFGLGPLSSVHAAGYCLVKEQLRSFWASGTHLKKGNLHSGLRSVFELRWLEAALCLFGPQMPFQHLSKEDPLSGNM